MNKQSWFWLVVCVGWMLLFVWVVSTPRLSVQAQERMSGATSTFTLRHSPASAKAEVILTHTDDITFTPAFTSYLPLVANSFSTSITGINGIVTYQGTPIADIPIELLRCNQVGAGWSCSALDTVSTNLEGRYQFTTAPSLGSAQKYVVRFRNSLNDARFLASWRSFSLLSYTAGQALAGGDFEIADIVILAPPSGSNVGLPATFQWQTRTGSPSDSYVFELYKPNESLLFDTPKLGYVGSYILNNLPVGFTTGIQYGWYVWIYGPSDSVGITNKYPLVKFH